MGKKGGGGGSTTTVQQADPWAGQQPYLKDVFQQAQNLYNAGGMAPNYYPGQTVANQSDWTKQAMQMQADRATAGSPLIDSASSAVSNITSGNALANNAGLNTLNELSQQDNPYVDELFSRANNQVQASLDSNFNRAGRYGSGAHEAAAADAANNLANQMYSSLWDKRADAAGIIPVGLRLCRSIAAKRRHILKHVPRAVHIHIIPETVAIIPFPENRLLFRKAGSFQQAVYICIGKAYLINKLVI